jgi:hypothetical protein
MGTDPKAEFLAGIARRKELIGTSKKLIERSQKLLEQSYRRILIAHGHDAMERVFATRCAFCPK